MTDLVIIVPSRGRPHAAVELAQAFGETCSAGTRLVFAVDEDDPTAHSYVAGLQALLDSGPPYLLPTIHLGGAPSNMVRALNEVAMLHVNESFAIGFMGDDHRPRTVGWDKAYVDALRELGSGIVYGNDLIQGPNLPTQFAMTCDIVRAIGHVAPPKQKHLYVDNYLKELGQRAGCLRYLPDVVVEHVHPVSGKVAWDEGHRRVNQPSMYAHDEAAYRAYVAAGHLAADVAKVKALRA